MKYSIITILLCLCTLNLCAQIQLCPTCKKSIAQCSHKGKHPAPKKCSSCGMEISKCPYKGKHPAPKKCSSCGMEISKCPYKGKHPMTKKCATCGKVVTQCPYKGNHPAGYDVTFTCNVPTAVVYIDQEDRGVASGMKYMTVGNHAVKVIASGYHDFESDVLINEDNRSVPITLQKRIVTGSLTVSSSPSGATVFVDGIEVGTTPCQLPDITEGQHVVELSQENCVDEKHTVDVAAGETTNLNLELTVKQEQKRHSAYKHDSKGYFHNTGIYVSPSLQVGSLMAIGVSVGGYINKFNIEGYYNYGLSKSDEVHWYKNDYGYDYVTYKPSSYGVKVGYGLSLTDNLRLTPQLGIGAVSLSGDTDGYNGNAISLGIGCKAEYAFLPYMSVGIAPELDMAISKSDTYTKISDASSSVNGWASGFNCRIFLSLFF